MDSTAHRTVTVMNSFVFLLRCLTMVPSFLHANSFLSGGGEVTLILRCCSGEGKAEGKGERETGVRDCGDRGSRLTLWAESVLLWPWADGDAGWVKNKRKHPQTGKQWSSWCCLHQFRVL